MAQARLHGLVGSWRPGAPTGRAYFAAQTVAGAAWWVCVFTVPAIRHATLGGLDPVLVAALDIPLFVGASALAAFGRRWAAILATAWTMLVTLALIAYATVTALAGVGALLMMAATAGSILATLLLVLDRLPTEWIVRGPFAFREARARPRLGHGASTAVQIVLFWTVLLGVVPTVIAVVEARWGLRGEIPVVARAVGAVLFIAAAWLGLWAAAVMARIGAGTPLPRFTAPRLVIAGPYRWVRNPMAVAGIGQGVMVGVMMSSWLVVVYALTGALVWNWLVRPYEEADLEARFGAPFVAYRDAVPCWVPRIPRPE